MSLTEQLCGELIYAKVNLPFLAENCLVTNYVVLLVQCRGLENLAPVQSIHVGFHAHLEGLDS